MDNCFLLNFNNPGLPEFSKEIWNFGVGLLSVVGLSRSVTVERERSNQKAKEMGVFRFLLESHPHLVRGFLKKKYKAQKEQLAATTIQKYFRGHLARKAHLKRSKQAPDAVLYKTYAMQCQKTTTFPRALGGKTPVYLPKDMPSVILKRSGRREAIARFHQMQQVRSVLSKQNTTHLKIPRANLCQNFLVEERLPIRASSIHNMGVYALQPELFDEAVREMTRFFSVLHLGDLIGRDRGWFGDIEGINDQVRYDNLPLYIVEKNGKKEGMIGLIDLEQSGDGPSPDALAELARIFPYHVDVIQDEARRLNLPIDEQAIKSAADKGKKYLDVAFNEHRQWLEKKKVSTLRNSQAFSVGPQTTEKLVERVKKELLFIHPELKVTQEDELANLVEEIINLMKSRMDTAQQERHDIADGELSSCELVDMRNVGILLFPLTTSISELLAKNTNIQEISLDTNVDVERRLISAILDELEKSADIFRGVICKDNTILIKY